MKLQAFGTSEKGLHLTNQDAFLRRPEKGLFAVADGVTISRGDSGLASRTAIELLDREFAGDLEAAFISINEAISRLKGAGTTTLTAAVVKGMRLDVCHVGDSCLLLVRGSVQKITEDDSRKGTNVLTQAIGGKRIQPHLYRLELQPGDTLLLLTDGVAKHVKEWEILNALKKELKDVPSELMHAAGKKKKLYEDDKTVIAVRV